jgi:hypothetical protein
LRRFCNGREARSRRERERERRRRKEGKEEKYRRSCVKQPFNDTQYGVCGRRRYMEEARGAAFFIYTELGYLSSYLQNISIIGDI